MHTKIRHTLLEDPEVWRIFNKCSLSVPVHFGGGNAFYSALQHYQLTLQSQDILKVLHQNRQWCSMTLEWKACKNDIFIYSENNVRGVH